LKQSAVEFWIPFFCVEDFFGGFFYIYLFCITSEVLGQPLKLFLKSVEPVGGLAKRYVWDLCSS